MVNLLQMNCSKSLQKDSGLMSHTSTYAALVMTVIPQLNVFVFFLTVDLQALFLKDFP